MKEMLQREILYLSRADVRDIALSMAEVIQLVESAFGEHGEGQIQMPPSTGVSPGNGAFVHAMPAYLPRVGALGAKWIGIGPHDLASGEERITGLLVLNDPATTLPICVMDCAWITAMRTGAVTGVAAKYLGRRNASVVAIIGAGVQGRTNLLALQEVLPDLERVQIYDINPGALDRYCEEMETKVTATIYPGGSAREAAQEAHVIVTATPVRSEPRPLVHDEWLPRGGLAIPLEIDSAWPPRIFTSVDKVLCDDRRQLQHAATGGFPIRFFKQGLPQIYAELGQVVSGQKPGREDDTERIISLNMGMGIHDVLVGQALYEKAMQKGIGTSLPL